MKDKENFAVHQEQKANYIKGKRGLSDFLIRKRSEAKKTMKWQLQRSQGREAHRTLYPGLLPDTCLDQEGNCLHCVRVPGYESPVSSL